MMRGVLIAFALLPAPALAQRSELPVRELDLPNGDRRFATTLTIDGQQVEVGIDTGSTGLRVLPRALGPSLSVEGAKVSYSYGAGTGFEGEVVSVPVAAGAVSGPIKLMHIQAVGCTDQRPNCPVAHMNLAHYGIQGDGIADAGFAAILGIRLQHNEVDNPFEQLGVKRWIVELPRTQGEAGRIVLNPAEDEVAAYSRVRVDENGTTPGCLTGLKRICARAFFDTGARGLRVIGGGARVWPDGTPATISVGEGAETQTMAVVIGRRDQAAGMLIEPGAGETRLSFGFAPYFHWSVLYDADAHQIGLKAR